MMKPSFKGTAAIVGLGFLLYGLQVFSPYWLHPVLYWSLPLFSLVFHPIGHCPNLGACLCALLTNSFVVTIALLQASRWWCQAKSTTVPPETASGKGGDWQGALKMAGRVVVMQTVGLLVLCCIPLVNIFVLLAPMAHLTNPGRFDRPCLEAVVKQVRLAGLKPGEQREFRLENLADPASLQPLDPARPPGTTNGFSLGDVVAEVSAENQLKVVVTTRTLGHMGTYGFAYSEALLVPRQEEETGSLILDVPGRLVYWGSILWIRPDMQVDRHWWRVQSLD